MPPTYRASATVVFEGGQRKPVSYEEVYRALTAEQGAHLTQAEFLQTTDVALRVDPRSRPGATAGVQPGSRPSRPQPDDPEGARLARAQPPAASRVEDSARSAEEYALRRFRERLTVDRLSQTQLFKVSFVSEDPQLAAERRQRRGIRVCPRRHGRPLRGNPGGQHLALRPAHPVEAGARSLGAGPSGLSPAPRIAVRAIGRGDRTPTLRDHAAAHRRQGAAQVTGGVVPAGEQPGTSRQCWRRPPSPRTRW